MKTTLLLLALLSLPVFAGDLPANAAALKGKRDAKIAEINQLYANELEKLQKLALKNGSLEAANAIEKEIAAVVPNPFVTGDDAVAKKLKGTAWKHEGSQKVMTFRTDGRLDKSWGKLTPEWHVKNGTISVEDSKMTISPKGSTMDVKGGDKDGEWQLLTPKS